MYTIDIQYSHHLAKWSILYQMCDVFFDLYNPFPLDPRRPLNILLYMFKATFNYLKGILGLEGVGGGKHLKQAERHQFRLSNFKRHGFTCKCISYACTEEIPYGFGNKEHPYP